MKSADLARKAAEKMFQDHPEIDKESIDFLLFLHTESSTIFYPRRLVSSKTNWDWSTHPAAHWTLTWAVQAIYGLSWPKGLLMGGIAKNVLCSPR